MLNPMEALPKLEGEATPENLAELKDRQIEFCKVMIKGCELLLYYIERDGAFTVMPFLSARERMERFHTHGDR